MLKMYNEIKTFICLCLITQYNDLHAGDIVWPDPNNYINLSCGYQYEEVCLTYDEMKTIKDDILNRFNSILNPEEVYIINFSSK